MEKTTRQIDAYHDLIKIVAYVVRTLCEFESDLRHSVSHLKWIQAINEGEWMKNKTTTILYLFVHFKSFILCVLAFTISLLICINIHTILTV